MQTTKSSLQTLDMELGLKPLTLCTSEDTQKHHNSSVMTSNLFSPPTSPSFCSQIGDYIGMESCLDLKNYEDLHTGNREDKNEASHVQNYRGKRDQRWTMKEKEFPPPISMLARTENQPSRMPFVLKRYYTSDGRLILREERVRHHEYFRAYRSNGHLTLQLVPLDDDVLADENENDEQYCNAEEDEEEEETAIEIGTEDANENGGDIASDVANCKNVEKEIVRKDIEGLTTAEYESKIAAESSVENGSVGMGGNGGGGEFLNYRGVRISSPSCFLGMPVPAIKPVHS